MMAATIKDGQVEVAAEQTRRKFSHPLQKGRERTVAVRLLGGLLVWATTLYCAPKKKLFRKDDSPGSDWTSRWLSSDPAKAFHLDCKVEWRVVWHYARRLPSLAKN